MLLGSEKQELESVAERIEELEKRPGLADTLPESIQRSHMQGARLVRALQKPVEECLSVSVRKNPEEISNALFPVMGPAIRKAVRESLRAFAQQLNQAIDNSLTFKGLTWRVQAWRAGVPFGDFVLRRTLLYRVEHAYLIHRQTGLLVEHAHLDAAAFKDDDAISAMLTAIQTFVKDSFAREETGRLETAEMGEYTLWIVHGPDCMLACLIRGVPPRALRGDLGTILEEIHLRYSVDIGTNIGGSERLPGLGGELERCLQLELKPESRKKRSRYPVSLIVVSLLVASLLAYFVGSRMLLHSKAAAFRDAVVSTPGLVLTGLETRGGVIVANGLRDPLARAPEDVAVQVGIPAEKFVDAFSPYHSLEPELLLTRVAKALDTPGSVDLGIDDGVLLVSGKAPFSWKTSAESVSRSLPGIASLNFEALDYFDRDWIVFARRTLGVPETVELTVSQGVLHLEGQAPEAWIGSLPTALAALPDFPPADYSAVESATSALLHLGRQIHGTAIHFGEGIQYADGEQETARVLATRLRGLAGLISAGAFEAEAVLIGETDASGAEAQNKTLRMRRAEALRAYLTGQGVPPSLLSVRPGLEAEERGFVDLSKRRVTVELALRDDAGVDIFNP